MEDVIIYAQTLSVVLDVPVVMAICWSMEELVQVGIAIVVTNCYEHYH